MFSIVSFGRIAVPILPDSSESEVSNILNHSECKAIFISRRMLAKLNPEVKSRLNFFNRDHAMFWREYMRDRAIVEPDGKVGRISVPKKLLEAIGVNKEVVFSGNDYKIEIWAREKFEEARISNEQYISLAGMLSQ